MQWGVEQKTSHQKHSSKKTHMEACWPIQKADKRGAFSNKNIYSVKIFLKKWRRNNRLYSHKQYVEIHCWLTYHKSHVKGSFPGRTHPINPKPGFTQGNKDCWKMWKRGWNKFLFLLSAAWGKWLNNDNNVFWVYHVCKNKLDNSRTKDRKETLGTNY